MFACRAARTAQDYPTRSVTILVPFAPGGGTDMLARAVAQQLEQRLGKPFVIENRPGAGTTIAAGATAKADARRLHADAGDQRHHGDESAPSSKACLTTPDKDLVPVALVAGVPFVLVVNADLPVHSVADLVKLAKEKPLTYGSGGSARSIISTPSCSAA